MRIILILLFGFCTLFSDSLSLSEEEQAWIKHNRNVHFTGDPNWLPFEAFNERGHYIGMVADHLDLIEDITGLNFTPHLVKDWSESLKIASEAKVSLISGDIADKTLNKNFIPIDPYLISPIVIIMDRNEHYVDKLESLKGKKIAIIKDYGYTAELFAHYPDMEFIEVANVQEGLLGVSEGKLDAMLASQDLSRYMIEKMGLENIKVIGKTSVIMSVTLFVDKKSPLLHSIINKAMHSVTSTQRQEISERWSSHNKKAIDPKWMGLALVLFLLMLFIFINFYKKAKEDKEKYSFAVEGSQDALWHWDIEHNTTFFSPQFKEILGFEDIECFSEDMAWTDALHPDDKASVLKLIEKNLQGNTDKYDATYRMKHKDGSWRWLHTRAKTSYDARKKPLRMDGICRDVTVEKELSLELLKSQQLLESIIDNIPVRIFWKDLKGTYLGYNKLFANDIDGKQSYDHIGKTDHDMPWKEEAQAYINDDIEVMTSAKAKLNIEELQTRPDGHKEWLSTSKVPLIDKDGKVFGIIGIYHDISTHKEHMLENAKKTSLLESAQEIGHMGSWEWNISTGELVWSDEVYRIFAEEPQSFPATYDAFTSYIPQEYKEGLEKAIEDAMTSKEPYEYDHEIRRKDGSLRLVREAGYVRYSDEGKPAFMIGTILDINSLIEVQSTLSQNKELTELLKKFDHNVIASNTDKEGVITYASEAFSKISGYSQEELLGSPQNIVRHEDMSKKIFEKLWKTIQSGKVWSGELKNRRKDGSEYWVETEISPTFNDNNEIIGYNAIRHDISYEKEVESLHHALQKKSDELQALNRGLEERITDAIMQNQHKNHLLAQQSKLASMGEMIGNIAHQWRQPLNALALLLQKQQLFFDRGLLTSQKIQESVKKGTTLINKMSTTIDDFRDFFKPNKEKADFDIKDAVQDTLELIDASLHNKNIALELNLPQGYSVHGYKNEFTQVILNLINNASDALVETGTREAKIIIDASLSQENKSVEIEICDNAGGIPEKLIEHIFEPYFTTKEEGKGTGIGLYMSKVIIEDNMGGTISVKNSDLGAVFTISMPLAKDISLVE